jgi:two-component system response regulator
VKVFTYTNYYAASKQDNFIGVDDLSGRVILLVEDNPDHEFLTIRALQKYGLAEKIIVARDGEEALRLLLGDSSEMTARAIIPNLILLDLKLPKLDGFEVLRQFRAANRSHWIPIVVLTSSDEEIDMVRAYSLGANSYIRKPIDFTQFMEIAKQLGHYWLVLNEGPSGQFK